LISVEKLRFSTLYLLLVAGLLSLATCRSDRGQTMADTLSSSPTVTRDVGTATPSQLETALPREVTKVTSTTIPTATAIAASVVLPPVTPLPSAPQQGGQITVGGLGRPNTLNPLLAESEASRALVPLLFDSLLAYDPNSGQVIPRLAETWMVADDGQSITFTLRTDALWHDGQPVLAGDVVFTIEAARDSTLDSLYGPQLSHVVEANAPDDATLVVGLDEPDCPSLAALGELPILPQHLLANSDLSVSSLDDAPVGSGPFVFVDWTPEGEVHLSRNEDYWGGVPYLDAWSYRPFANAADLQRAWESGQIDAALMPPGRLPGMIDSSLSLKANQSVYHYLSSEFVFVAFNNEYPILSDSRVRLALSMAVDRQQLLDQALDGRGELIAATLPSTHWATDPALRPPPYDPDGARQLLAEAGWSDSDGDGWLDREGERLRLPIRTNAGDRLREDVAILVADYYRAIGIDASTELVAWGALVDDLFTHDFEAIVFGWPLPADPDQSRWWLSTENGVGIGYNFVSFADERVDRLLQEALTVPGCDSGRRAERYQQIQHLLAEERPYDFLLIPYATVLTRPSLHGLVAGSFAGPQESAAAWYVDTTANH
jgi:peptide/nickel transport system substrate-binding protein